MITAVDWTVIGIYLLGLVVMAAWLSRGQSTNDDYYLGGRKIGRWPVAISIIATQCSTNSILGAPAFVAFSVGGGLAWLQYELAVPLAMVVLILVFFPIFRGLNLTSVYEYLELRFDLKTRLILSGIFMFVRAFATSVTVYSIAIVIDLITGLGFFWSIILLGLFTIIYDVLGGVKGVIYSDVLQMLILSVVLIIIAIALVEQAGGLSELTQHIPRERLDSLRFDKHGLGDGNTFAFWPMLFGGFFLYVSYYGCDQSQAQRVLSTRSLSESQHALFINGLMRFPLVALYCFVGLGIGVFAANNPEFIHGLPQTGNDTTNFNLAVPTFMISQLPTGIVGLSLVALFAAAMSSLDSVLNSLSATTMEDYVKRLKKTPLSQNHELLAARAITSAWGILTLIGAFFVEDIAPTVLEAINKIGSLINGPVLGVFTAGVLSRFVKPEGAIIGLLAGFITNVSLWLLAPSISWLWWNVVGFVVTLACAYGVSFAGQKTVTSSTGLIWQMGSTGMTGNPSPLTLTTILSLWFLIIATALFFL